MGFIGGLADFQVSSHKAMKIHSEWGGGGILVSAARLLFKTQGWAPAGNHPEGVGGAPTRGGGSRGTQKTGVQKIAAFIGGSEILAD